MSTFHRLTPRIKFNGTAFIFWCVISLIFPLVSGTMGLVETVKCLVFLFVATCIGEYLAGWVSFMKQIPPMLRIGFAMITGGTILFPVFSVFPMPVLIYILLLLFLLLFLFTKNISWEIDTRGLAAIIPVCILLISATDIPLATSRVFTAAPGDYFYYDVLVVSLSKTLTINDSLFHTGIPVNYQTLTFFYPAAMAYSTGIPAHIAWDGIVMPVIKVLSFSMASASVIYLYSQIKHENNLTISWKYYTGASTALLLIAPLHPLYLLKFNIKNFILLGEGYLLPMGSIGFALAILLFSVLNFFFFSSEKKRYPDIAFFIILLGSIAVIKSAMFFPLLAFYGLYAITVFITDRKDKRILYLFSGLIVGALLMKLFEGNADGLIKMSLTLKEGYFPGLFRDTMQKFNRPATLLTGVVFLGVMFFLWMGIKTIIFADTFLSKPDYAIKVKPFIVACLGCIIISILPEFFIKILAVDEKGHIFHNTTFDTTQFLRAGLFISTFISTLTLLFVWGKKGSYKSKLFKGVILAWFGLVGLSLIKGLTEPEPPTAETDPQWEHQVAKDFHVVHPRLLAMLSTSKYSGQILVAQEIYPWWTCARRGDANGYVATLRSNYRNNLLEGLINDTVPHTKKTEIIQQLHHEGVDALVATPINKNRFDLLVADSILTKPANSTWIYRLKN